MLERLNQPGMESISRGSAEAIAILKRVKEAATGPVVAAEIGIGIGATTVELLNILGPGDELDLFDRSHYVAELIGDLEALPASEGINIVDRSNDAKLFSSYAWVLAVWLRELRRADQPVEVFDFVYLDGAHQFLHDAAAVAVLKQMVKPGGYIVFDDMEWTFEKSPTLNPQVRSETARDYPEDQLVLPHVELVVDVLMRPDRAWKEVRLKKAADNARAVFRRKNPAAKPKQPPAPRPLWRRAAGRLRRALR